MATFKAQVLECLDADPKQRKRASEVAEALGGVDVTLTCATLYRLWCERKVVRICLPVPVSSYNQYAPYVAQHDRWAYWLPSKQLQRVTK